MATTIPKSNSSSDFETKDVGIAEIASPAESVGDVDKTTAKAAYRKADRRILLWYSFVYLIMRIHVSNITNTAIINIEEGDGIKQQLGNLNSEQWAWVLSIFYYPHMFAEPASTMLLKHFSPSVWMSRIMVTWGIISMCQGATQNYAGILATRFLLGLAEAGYYPGVLYHLSFWYPAKSTPLRIAFFYACGQFSGTISCLLAFAISYMNGVGNLAGWRWVFILEGIPAILCGVYTYFMLPNYPETARFLTEDERQTIIDNLPKTQPSSTARTWNTEQVKAIFTDPTTATFTLIWIFHAIGGWGVQKVLPTVIFELGLTDSAISQLLTMPTYAFGCTCLVLIGWTIQRQKLRPWIAAMVLEVLTMICYIILIVVNNSIAKYVLVTLATACSICIYPILWPERIRVAHGTTAAGLTIGLTNAAAQFNGILGPQVYRPKFGPSYKVSYSVSIGLLAGAIVYCGNVVFGRQKGSSSIEPPLSVGSGGIAACLGRKLWLPMQHSRASHVRNEGPGHSVIALLTLALSKIVLKSPLTLGHGQVWVAKAPSARTKARCQITIRDRCCVSVLLPGEARRLGLRPKMCIF